MITVSFHSSGAKLSGFTVSGHSGLAVCGQDVLCAAVTSAVRLTECAVNDVLGLDAAVKVRPENAVISLKLPGGLSESTDALCQTLFSALMVYLSQLQEEFPNNLFVCDADA